MVRAGREGNGLVHHNSALEQSPRDDARVTLPCGMITPPSPHPSSIPHPLPPLPQGPIPPAEAVKPAPNYLKWALILAAAYLGNWALSNTAVGVQLVALVQAGIEIVKTQVCVCGGGGKQGVGSG